MIALSLLLAIAQSAPPADAPAPAPDPIVVTGERQRQDGEEIEEPFPEVERVPVGSRIPRRSERRTFRTIATDQGVAGLLSAPGLNFDAGGGQLQRVRNRVVRECVADDSQVSERTACILFRVRQAIGREDHAAAAALLEPLLRSGTLSGIDRFYVASFNYQLALATDDDARRETALTNMLESRHMPAADRPNAMRILAQLAARRGDDGAAIARIERLVAEMPDEPRNHADLAWLYARGGREGEAVPRMTMAVRLARQAGTPVPQAWLDFLSADP